jgi:hypothetical protein
MKDGNVKQVMLKGEGTGGRRRVNEESKGG